LGNNFHKRGVNRSKP